jgi:hypothetical protein
MIGSDHCGHAKGIIQFVATAVRNKIQDAMICIVVVIALIFLGLVTLAGIECTETTHDEDQ